MIDPFVDEEWRDLEVDLMCNGYCGEHVRANDTCQYVSGHVDIGCHEISFTEAGGFPLVTVMKIKSLRLLTVITLAYFVTSVHTAMV